MYSSNDSLTCDVRKLQSDILIENLEDNELFRPNSVVKKSTQLRTQAQNIIGAINELGYRVDGIENDSYSNLVEIHRMLGSMDQSLLNEMEEKGTSLVEIVMNNMEIVKDLTLKSQPEYKDTFRVENAIQNQFVLSHVSSGGMHFFVNGVEYFNEKDDITFQYDEETNIVTWCFTPEFGGFNISNCIVTIVYRY